MLQNPRYWPKKLNSRAFLGILTSEKIILRFCRKHLGRDVTVSLGHVPIITIENAHKLALKHAADLSQGQNPNEVKRDTKQLANREPALFMSVQQLSEVEFELKIKYGQLRVQSL